MFIRVGVHPDKEFDAGETKVATSNRSGRTVTLGLGVEYRRFPLQLLRG